MTSKMNTPAAKEVYKLRQQIVEPVIGDIKENKGLRTFLTRGIDAVRTEFNLACSAVNLKKIWTVFQRSRPATEKARLSCFEEVLLEHVMGKADSPVHFRHFEIFLCLL